LKVERPRATRCLFCAPLLLTDLKTGNATSEYTKDLSLFGCNVVPGDATPLGTRTRIQIAYKGQIFQAFGQVVYVRKGGGAGIAFTKIEPRYQLVLDEWIAELRNRNAESPFRENRT